MKMKKVIVLSVVLVLAGLSWFGYKSYVRHVREAADKRAGVCLREYYSLVGDGYPSEENCKKLAPLLVEMAELSKKTSAGVSESLFSRRLDGSFLINDFATAERLMDELPDKSENWKTGAKAKIRAHAALTKGDKATALKEFEAFCESQLKEDPDAREFDPYTGVEWPKEGVLGRNMKRMSGLAADTGDKAKSAKYLEEAKRYGKAAIEKVKDDPESKSAMEKEFSDILK